MKKPSFYISNWMSGVDICKLKRNIDGKQVYVLDDDKDYQFIKDFLNENGIDICGFTTIEEIEKMNEKDIHDIFSPETNFTRGAGYWGISGIIKETFLFSPAR